MRLSRLIFVILALLAPTLSAQAQESGLVSLETADDSRGWNSVGKLMLGKRGFCTGALIAPQLVLTAAHCLFDKETGARIDPKQIEFRAGWRNGRAEAYRGVRRAVAHPEYIYGGHDALDRVAFDLALIELDQPIRLPSIRPFELDQEPSVGDEVAVVSYAQDRSEAPSIQEVCRVISHPTDVLVLSCNVDFGASGSPVFTITDGVPRIASVISAKAEVDGTKVALAVSLVEPLSALQKALDAGEGAARSSVTGVRVMSGGSAGGAKFVKP